MEILNPTSMVPILARKSANVAIITNVSSLQRKRSAIAMFLQDLGTPLQGLPLEIVFIYFSFFSILLFKYC